jgi:hypothetical protein
MLEVLLVLFGIFGAGFATGYFVRTAISHRRRAQYLRDNGML